MPRKLAAACSRRNIAVEFWHDTCREIERRYHARLSDHSIARQLRIPVRVVTLWRTENFLVAN